MVDQLEKDSLEKVYVKVNTHTVVSDDTATETLLISIDLGVVGCKNSMTPEDFNQEHISSWMRSNYHISNGEIIAQVPRKIRNYPKKAKEIFGINNENSHIKNISIKENQVKIHYPIEDINKNIVVSWDVFSDDWKMTEEEYQEDIKNKNSKEELLWPI